MPDQWLELVKLWGPLSLGWLVAAYLGKFVIDRYDKDIESRAKLAIALQELSDAIKEKS